MRILFLGDVVGSACVRLISEELKNIREDNDIDFVIANGENAANIHGISASDVSTLLYAGVDFLTSGNHIWGRQDIIPVLEREERLIRPLNYSSRLPGSGALTVSCNGTRILIMNVSGVAFMEPLDNPFDAVERALTSYEGKYDISVLDVHAEATSEKLAIANYFDGRINMIVGTHTHVQTADERILPKGTAYITDLGMCGPLNSIIGVKTENVILKQRNHTPARFEVADGPIELRGAIFDVDEFGGRVRSVKRFVRLFEM